MISMKFLLLLLIVISSAYSAEEVVLYILSTNDHHGRYWPDRHGRWGGMAAQKTFFDRVRKHPEENSTEQTPHKVLTLLSGDILTGTFESDWQW